jgi:3-oxoacyl-[acyl-carrier protein] reductase
MDLGLSGKRVMIGGASSGIGRKCAELMAAEGADLFLIARGEEKLRQAADDLKNGPGQVTWHAADLSTAVGVDSGWKAAEERLGGIDVVINNAGGPKPGPFNALDDDDWEAAFQLTLMSSVRMMRRALPGMTGRGWGRIVNIMSTSVRQPVPNLMLSNSLRMAVVGLSKTLLSEIGGSGVTINTVGPGFASTERLSQLAAATAGRQGLTVDEVYARWASEVPLGRIGTPEEIAAAVVFLASGPAAYINGVFLPVDGGRIKASL